MVVPLSGCPGGADLEDPSRFVPIGVATGGGSGSGAGVGATGGAGTSGSTFVPPACDYRSVIQASCGSDGCHHTTPNIAAAAGLDLRAEGVEARLIGQLAPHAGLTCPNPDGGLPVPCVPPGCDPTDVFVKPGDPAGSYLLKKIAGTHGDCGRAMPILPGKLDAAGRACLEDWIEALANAQ
jgi:hypothetical protein